MRRNARRWRYMIDAAEGRGYQIFLNYVRVEQVRITRTMISRITDRCEEEVCVLRFSTNCAEKGSCHLIRLFGIAAYVMASEHLLSRSCSLEAHLEVKKA